MDLQRLRGGGLAGRGNPPGDGGDASLAEDEAALKEASGHTD